MANVPMFYDKEKQPIHLENIYSGQSCFLILSGPSLKTYDLEKLKQPGIITFGVNNSPKIIRPNLWTCVDDPANFMISIWKDPTIMKFVPHPKVGKTKGRLFDNIAWKYSDLEVKDCPGMVYIFRNEHFQHEQWFYEDTINWGNHKDYGGGRSVMLQAMRIISLLGFKNVFLLGADFKMGIDQQNYAFDQDRTRSSIKNNNKTYRLLNERFDLLYPIFLENEFYVFNCYKDSGLKSFPYLDYESALKIALEGFPDTEKEDPSGMYDRKANQRSAVEHVQKEIDAFKSHLDACQEVANKNDKPELKSTFKEIVKHAKKELKALQDLKSQVEKQYE